ncbi:MAG: MotA/TolQ/ExbB proton channel family protein [Gammaproteobacteria bacterium]|nr:MotA/TolQ/ExbB proton channel family protein [Gammaproteobacteria bacterium]
MDFATLAGLISGIAVITFAVSSGSDFLIFVNLPGFLIVAGGTAAAVLIKFPLKICIQSFVAGIKTAFIDRSERPEELILLATKLTTLKRKKGNLALQDTPIKNTLFKKGIELLVDGHKVDFIKKVLRLEMEHAIERHEVGERVFRAIGDSAPAFGMIGTLVGLVQMLSNMQDPSALGAGMAVALLTTLYGSLIANLIAIPIADKLQMRHESEFQNKTLILECILGIEKGENPRVMEEILITYLSGNQRKNILNHNHDNAEDSAGDDSHKTLRQSQHTEHK